MPHIKRRVVTLLKDVDMPEGEKIHILRQMEADSLSKERSSTEGMPAFNGDDGEDLHVIEMALRRLGQQPVIGGAASL